MPRFEVEVSGHLYRKWPSGEEITLADCRFIPSNSDREFIVQTEVEADNEEQARQAGLKTCLDAAHLLEFCIEEPVDLSESRGVQVREKGSAITTTSSFITLFGAGGVDAPLTKEQLEAVAKAQGVIQAERDPEKRESLMRAIHWQARGRRETQSQIDRFIKFWIALEVLVEGRGKKVVTKVKKPLIKLYPSCSEQKIADVVGRIYGVRNHIVHLGIREPQYVAEKLRQLEDILEDLLRQRMGLDFKALAKQHLV